MHPQIKLRTMDEITELADLAEEQEQKVCVVRKEELIDDFDEEFSTSESESTEQELDDSVPIEKVPYKESHYQHSFHINR